MELKGRSQSCSSIGERADFIVNSLVKSLNERRMFFHGKGGFKTGFMIREPKTPSDLRLYQQAVRSGEIDPRIRHMLERVILIYE